MKDSEAAIIAAIGVSIVFLALTLSATAIISDKLRYEAFIKAQVNVLTCRADRASASRPETLDRVCGMVPVYKDFND